jgi:hypothetical protein
MVMTVISGTNVVAVGAPEGRDLLLGLNAHDNTVEPLGRHLVADVLK